MQLLLHHCAECIPNLVVTIAGIPLWYQVSLPVGKLYYDMWRYKVRFLVLYYTM